MNSDIIFHFLTFCASFLAPQFEVLAHYLCLCPIPASTAPPPFFLLEASLSCCSSPFELRPWGGGRAPELQKSISVSVNAGPLSAHYRLDVSLTEDLGACCYADGQQGWNCATTVSTSPRGRGQRRAELGGSSQIT